MEESTLIPYPSLTAVITASVLPSSNILLNSLREIPDDSNLKNLKAMMKETAKALQMRLDELEELSKRKPPAHKMTSFRKNASSKKD